jgi:hypothetical protein
MFAKGRMAQAVRGTMNNSSASMPSNARYKETMAVPLAKLTDEFLTEEESLNLLMVLTAKQDLANPSTPIA